MATHKILNAQYNIESYTKCQKVSWEQDLPFFPLILTQFSISIKIIIHLPIFYFNLFNLLLLTPLLG